MNLLDYAYGIAVVCWLGSLAQLAVIMASAARRTRARA